MRTTLLAFFGLAFVIYWFSTAELPHDRAASLDPVMPFIQTMRVPKAEKKLPVPDSPKGIDVDQWVKTEALKVGQVDTDPAQSLLRMRGVSNLLRKKDFVYLKQLALDGKANGDERFVAIYILGLSPSSRAQSALREVAVAKIPKSNSDRLYSEDVVIRAHALEAMVKRLPPADAKQFLKDVLRRTSDPALAKHVEYWLARMT